MSVEVIHGDCLTELPRLAAEGFRAHAVVTDPPAGIGFMGREWDSDKGGRDHWIAWMQQVAAETLRCVRPGAHALVWALPRTSHWTATAWENAGWTVRDRVAHLFGTGFPKSLDVSKAIDRAAGAEREITHRGPVRSSGMRGGAYIGGDREIEERNITAPATPDAAAWAGWGTALKPAVEDWWLFRKPLEGTVAANVLAYGTGCLNIDACRVPGGKTPAPVGQYGGSAIGPTDHSGERNGNADTLGRWPANLLHDGSPEVEQAFAAFGDKGGGFGTENRAEGTGIYGSFSGSTQGRTVGFGDTGSASRFFYTAKADANDRQDSKHPTVKPAALMRWLVRLVTPPGGTVLDPFCGTGSTGLAADQLGMSAVLIERDAQYAADARNKIIRDGGLFAEVRHTQAAPPPPMRDLFAAE